MSLPPEALRRVVEAGSLAPSGDNLQPWIVAHDGEGIRVTVDPSRDRSLYNFQLRPSLIALGAMVENMVIAARHAGFEARVALEPGADERLRSASLSFEPAEGPPDELFDWIPRRCTNRRPYARSAIPAASLAALRDLAATDSAELRFVERRADMRTVAAAASLNDRLLFEVRALHDGFYETIRWTPEEAERSRDGLFIKTLELGPILPSFKASRSWGVVRAMNLLGMSRMAPLHSRQTFMRSGAFGFLQVDGLSPETFFSGGRTLQRIWLKATALGLGFQPMAGMLYLLWYPRSGGASPFTPGQERLLAKAEALLARVLPLREGRAAIMLFRIGRAPAPSATALRRPLIPLM